ncbi:MAG: hypothetical protein AAB927_01665 [Patescibacteria group bacterium]
MDQASQDFQTTLQRARSTSPIANLELPILPGVTYDKVADVVEQEAACEVALLLQLGPQAARETLISGFIRAAAQVAHVASAIG